MFKSYLAVFAVFSVATPAIAQTSPNASRVLAASVEAGDRGASQAGRWACAATSSFEIMEVSDDVITDRVAYVLIEKVKGEPVASQRLSQAEVAAFRRLGCESKSDSVQSASAIG